MLAMADDLTGVPTGEWEDLRRSARDHKAMLLVMWALVLVLVLTLVRKGVIGWDDLAHTAGWHG